MNSDIVLSSTDGTPAQVPQYTFAQKKGITGQFAFLLPYLKPDFRILDVGRGPGSITYDFAALVPRGTVVGIDQASSVLEQVRELEKERGLQNIEFLRGYVLKPLPFPDASFDVVFTHSSDPARALREMKRLTKPGGMVAN